MIIEVPVIKQQAACPQRAVLPRLMSVCHRCSPVPLCTGPHLLQHHLTSLCINPLVLCRFNLRGADLESPLYGNQQKTPSYITTVFQDFIAVRAARDVSFSYIYCGFIALCMFYLSIKSTSSEGHRNKYLIATFIFK